MTVPMIVSLLFVGMLLILVGMAVKEGELEADDPFYIIVPVLFFWALGVWTGATPI